MKSQKPPRKGKEVSMQLNSNLFADFEQKQLNFIKESSAKNSYAKAIGNAHYTNKATNKHTFSKTC